MDLVRRATKSCIATAALALLPAMSTGERPHYCGTVQWQSLIATAAERFELPEPWLHAVMRAESSGCEMMNGAPTVSSAGAMGLMQLMPNTWVAYREKLQLGDDPHNPGDNILAGSAYLRDLYDRHGWPGAAAAYHAGPSRYEEHVSDVRQLPRSTLDYLEHIERLTGDPTSVALVERTLFVVRPPAVASSDAPASDASSEDLFVTLRHSIRHSSVDEQAPTDVQK
jgi:soluble lytic murein transglycosylase-like protein